METILANNVRTQFKHLGLQQNPRDPGLSYQLQLLQVDLQALLVAERGRTQDQVHRYHEGVQIVEAIVIQQVFQSLGRS